MIISENQRPSNISMFSRKYTDAKEPIHNFFIERYFESYKNQLDSFIHVILKNKIPTVNFSDGKKALLISNSAYESLKKKKLIKFKL